MSWIITIPLWKRCWDYSVLPYAKELSFKGCLKKQQLPGLPPPQAEKLVANTELTSFKCEPI